ncbi:hypothetical protein B0T09DRAFT_354556 [Sordaria sp. MPI-SDFR-AT-0083]|nr:hypothetical protein B0T09DRAFT_354556 [Sordaria sp. MPI-SDFR-AT-0083]
MDPRAPTGFSPSPSPFPPQSPLLTSVFDLDFIANMLSEQVDKTNTAATAPAHPAPLAGTRRPRAHDNDKDEVPRPTKRRLLNNGQYAPLYQEDYITHQPSRDLTCGNQDLAGCILWAGNAALKAMTPQDGLTVPHPVLIMSPRVKDDGTVNFLVCTSFSGLNLSERIPENGSDRGPELAKQARSYFLPIEGTEPHPDDPIRNFLVKTTKMPHSKKRSSYVNTMVLRTTRFDCLEPYRDGGRPSQDYSIDELSYRTLVLFMKNRPPPSDVVLKWGTIFKGIWKERKTKKPKGQAKMKTS